MALFKHTVDTPEAVDVMFSPSSSIPASNVQEAIQYVWDNVNGGVSGTYAPIDAQYIVSASNATLDSERVLTDTATITWDDGTSGQMKANWQHLGLESLSDPGADRILVWDDSAGATAFFSLDDGLVFSGSSIGIGNANLQDLRDITFTTGDLLYYDGANLNTLAIGSNYQFLRVNGSGALEWLTFPTGSGAGDMLSVNNLSDVASVSGARASLSVYSIAETDAAIAAAVTAEDLDFAGDTGTGAVDLDSQSLTIATTNDSLTTSATAQTLTIALADVLEDLDTLGPSTADGEFLVATGAGTLAWESGATARASLGVDPAGTDNSTNVTLVTTSHDYLSIVGQAITLGPIDLAADVTGALPAASVSIADAGALITATTVEGALAENRAAIDAIEADYLVAADIANMLETSDIGVTVQGYDADTAKYDDVTANFTGTLQNGGSNVLVDSDIGSTVQAYDADLTTWAGITPGTGVGTALAVNVGTAGAFVVNGGALGTPSSGTLTNATGLPVSSGISGLGTGVATALAVAVGSAGAPVVNGGALGTPSSGTLTNCTGLPLSGIVDSTSEALGIGSLELGHASDTTITRVSAGVIAVEGSNVLLASNIGSTVQGYDADTLKADTADVLTAGFAQTPYSAGTKSSGTFTPDEANGNFQYATNGGAHTLAPPTNSGTLVILYANNASAGAITTSGFTMVTGDSFTTTDGHEFMCYVTKNNNGSGFSHLHVTALQ